MKTSSFYEFMGHENYRPCLCVHSGQYIRNHVLYPALKPDDFLFNVSVVTIWFKLKELAQKIGIDKPISSHMFRHAQATYMVRKGYQESIIRAKLGWTDDSSMIARYVSIDKEKDVHNATLQIEGTQQPVIDKELVKGIKIAAPIAIADPSLQLNQIMNENADLKEKVVGADTQLLKLSEDNEWLRSNMINMKEMMSDYEQELRELREELKQSRKK